MRRYLFRRRFNIFDLSWLFAANTLFVHDRLLLAFAVSIVGSSLSVWGEDGVT